MIEPQEEAAPKKRKASPLSIGTATIRPGETTHLDLKIARLPTYTKLTVPVIVRHGLHDGPRIWLSAALHGDELNGIEIIHRVLSILEEEQQTRGTIIAVPIVNVLGFIHQSRYLPDGRDLNRSFPGSKSGSLASRMARLFMDEIVGKCTHGIDLHTGSNHRSNLPQIRANLEHEPTAEFARAFGAPVTLHAQVRDGSLRYATSQRQLPVLVYEAGEANRFDEVAIEAGCYGVLRALRYLKLAKVKVDRPRKTHVMRKSKWLRARYGGLLRLDVGLGAMVTRGQKIGTIGDPFGEANAIVKATTDGIVIGLTQNPVVYQGDALVHVATQD